MSGTHASSAISARVRRMETLLEDRGVVSGEELDLALDRYLRTARTHNGARIAARAWVDADFRERLLSDATSAIGDLGLSMAGGIQPQRLRVAANSPTEHNVIVCTLCSCYPVGLLGPSPSWYKSAEYRARVVRDPRGVLAEFGVQLAPDVHITVWDSSAESRYMVLPQRPDAADGRSEEQLAAAVTRNGLIGTALV